MIQTKIKLSGLISVIVLNLRRGIEQKYGDWRNVKKKKNKVKRGFVSLIKV